LVLQRVLKQQNKYRKNKTLKLRFGNSRFNNLKKMILKSPNTRQYIIVFASQIELGNP
jgi:hypothetical protein